MNGRDEGRLIVIGMIIFGIIFFFCLFRFIVLSPGMSSDNICKLENGGSWEYEDTSSFGKTCIELDYVSLEIVNRTKLNITLGEAYDKYCSRPGFWELGKWNDGCLDG